VNCYHQQHLHKVPNGYGGLGGTASAARSVWPSSTT